MTAPNTGLNRQQVQRLIIKQIDPGLTDRELLERFANRQDQAAFEVLMHRHGPMVLATGRRVLGNAHNAEDVLQATFLLLAQKAASGRWRTSVASWLHQTARLLALKALRTTTRRTRREKRATTPIPTNPLAEMSGQELLAVLDEELLALPETLRAPLVLCYLEGATRDEAAERLGCSLATIKKRLERGRDKLHNALTRRGVGLSAALLGTLLVGQSGTALTTPLIRQTAHTALALATGQAMEGLIPPYVGQLMNGGIGMVGWNKLKAMFCVLLLGGLLTAAGAVAPSGGEDKPPPMPAKDAAKQDKPADPPVRAVGEMKVIVLDPLGQPLPGANVHAGIWTNEKDFKANRDIETDASGVARVPLPKTFYILRLWAGKQPFVTLFANWEQAELSSGKGVPAEYTFRLESTTRVGGRIVNDNGKPVAGAKVGVSLANQPKPPQSDGRVRYNTWLAWNNDAATTDAEGRWHVGTIPNHPELELSLLITHPDYVPLESWRQASKAQGITLDKLKTETATIALKAGVVVRGQVTDPVGKPIKDALVIHGDEPYFTATTCTFSTDSEGKYRLPALASGQRSLTVITPGWAPQFRKVDLKPDLKPQDFRMAAGKLVRLRIVDSSGKPIPNASVTLMEWQGGSKSIYSGRNPNHPKVPETGIAKRTDAMGVWEWLSAPDASVKIEISARGYAPTEMAVTGGVTDRTVTLKAEHQITGTVTDAVTGKPIPNFTIIPVDVFRKDFLNAERFNAVVGKAGQLSFLATRTDIPLRLRVEAPGYRTQDGPEFRVGDNAGRKQNFRLQPSPPITGRVVDADGKPVEKVTVFLATPTEQVSSSRDDNHRAVTDAAGRFEFPDPGEPWAVIAQSDAGFSSAEFLANQSDAGTLKLRPWGSIRGKFVDNGKPVRGATIFLNTIHVNNLYRPRINTSLQTTTDAEGRFEFPRVSPGLVYVRAHLGPWKDEEYRSGPSVPIDLKPGKQVDLDLGSDGAVLTGKVKLVGKVPADLDCAYSLNYLVRREPGVTPPPDVVAAGFDARKGWRDTWHETEEGLAFLTTLQYWFVKLSPDGTFRISGVPPGEYDLAVAVYSKPSGCLTDPLGRQVVRVTVTPEDAKRGEMKLPDVSVKIEPIPEIGDTPTLSFKKVDGNTGALADYRKKYLAVHFWASWCVPCKKQLPEFKKIQKEFADRGLETLSLSLDDNHTAWQGAVKTLELPWSQGRLGGGGAHGVSSVPTYWLLDPTGKIVAKVYSPDELGAAIKEHLKQSPTDRKRDK